MAERSMVTIPLNDYEHMKNQIEHLKESIDDLKLNKELVTWQRGNFSYSYWFYNASEKTTEVLKTMNEISEENEKLRAALLRASAPAFIRFFRGDF